MQLINVKFCACCLEPMFTTSFLLSVILSHILLEKKWNNNGINDEDTHEKLEFIEWYKNQCIARHRWRHQTARTCWCAVKKLTSHRRSSTTGVPDETVGLCRNAGHHRPFKGKFTGTYGGSLPFLSLRFPSFTLIFPLFLPSRLLPLPCCTSLLKDGPFYSS